MQQAWSEQEQLGRSIVNMILSPRQATSQAIESVVNRYNAAMALSDPYEQSRALGQLFNDVGQSAAGLGYPSAALVRPAARVATTIGENAFTGPVAGSRRAQLGAVGDVSNTRPTSTAGGTSSFSTAERSALREAGYSELELARHVELNGDLYVFRGTSPGFEGNPGPGKTYVSATPDPYSATVFEIESRTQSGRGVVSYGPRADFGELVEGNTFRLQEREIGLPMNAVDYANRAPNSIPVEAARQILNDMGLPPLPYRLISRAERNEMLDSAPRMTPEQVAEFIRRARMLDNK